MKEMAVAFLASLCGCLSCFVYLRKPYNPLKNFIAQLILAVISVALMMLLFCLLDINPFN